MSILGLNQYGKAEVHMVTVTRDGPVHTIRDLLVGIALSGDLAEVHLTGDNANVVATDTQKNVVYAFAKEAPVGAIEDFALRLGRHFVSSFAPITRARVHIVEADWDRLADHSFRRAGAESRVATVVCEQDAEWVVSGISDLVVLNSTDSEFEGFIRDRYTTLAETRDRLLATEVAARWRHRSSDGDWDASFAATRALLLDTFAGTYSKSLQQTLYAMADAMLAGRPELAEVRMSLPNKHHYVVDLSPFGLENDNEVFHADDRPYGLIEAAVLAADAPPAGPAWDPYPLLP
ncbi:MAG: urate oxidase [Solirubrobacteraceae bacterium]|nr:urate oxidase [Solirubrobacteraceae bacterium]